MTANEEKKQEGKQLLIVDDDRFLLEMYATKFLEHGYQVEIAFNATETLDKLEKGLKPTAMLLDVVMPEMDGLSLIQEIRKRGLQGDSAIIILSNLGNQEEVDKGLELGVDGYIIKASATPTEVVERVGQVLETKKK